MLLKKKPRVQVPKKKKQKPKKALQEAVLEQKDTNPLGRPPKYKGQETIDLAKKFLEEECYIEEEKVLKSESHGATSESKGHALYFTPNLPTKTRLAEYLKIHRDTLDEWVKTYSAFSDIVKELRRKYEDMLIEGGVTRKFDPSITKLLLHHKFGYADKKEVEYNASDLLDMFEEDDDE